MAHRLPRTTTKRTPRAHARVASTALACALLLAPAAHAEVVVDPTTTGEPSTATAPSPEPTPELFPVAEATPTPQPTVTPVPQQGWVLTDAGWFYYQANGTVATGWLQTPTGWYFMQPDGRMATGWVKTGGEWYFLDPTTGAMAAGWVLDSGRWYLLGGTGAMLTGWQWYGERWYLLAAGTGEMQTGWVRTGSYWYYLQASGAMASGWVFDGRWYYLNWDGSWRVDMLVNKRNPVSPQGYEPPLVSLASLGIGGGQWLHPEAADALTTMFADARAAGHSLTVTSGYRSYGTQQSIFNNEVAQNGREWAELVSARPGYSEHQTGLAADVWSPNQGCYLGACFGSTAAGRWLAANSWRYGFIIRYPEGYTATTGYTYEPWHFRYVGIGISHDMVRNGQVTLEAYYGAPAAPSY